MRFKSPNVALWSDFIVWTFFFLIGIIVLNLHADTLQLTYDSRSYIKASESAEIYFFEENNIGIPYLHRQPVLPAYLHFFENKLLASWWLNVLCYATSLLLCFKIGCHLDLKRWFLYGALILIAFNYPWLQNHFFLWTEPLFSVFILLLVYCLFTHKHVSVVVAVCIIAFFVRKPGLFLFIGATVCYLLKREYKNCTIVGSVMLFVFIGWEVLGLYLSQVSISANIYNYLSELSRMYFAEAMFSWILPRVVPLYIRILVTLIAVLIIIVGFKNSIRTFLKKDENQILLVIVTVYIACFIIPIGVPDYHEAERYLSVVIPLVLLAFFSFCNEIHFATAVKRKLFLIVLGLWSLYPLGRTIYHFF